MRGKLCFAASAGIRALPAKPRGVIFRRMSTLAEIEAAAETLPLDQKKELIDFLTRHVQGQTARRGAQASDLAEFSGALRLGEDALEWQQRVRDEWK
jgi:hypothetical protein